MKYWNGKRGLFQAVALGQVLLLAAAGCKSSVNNGVNPVAVAQALDLTVTASGFVVNGYAGLAADATAGDMSVRVTTLSAPDSGAYNGLQGLAAGDLVLIIQMAGASIDPNDAVDYGTVTNFNNAGKYELNTVASTTLGTNTIGLACALKNSYSATGKAQVIRVPQYGTLIINSGASITAPAWDGAVGGVVAVQAAQLNVTGAINVSEMGFHGGAIHVGGGPAATDVATYRSALDTVNGREGGEKGEGIAGWPNHDSATAFPYPYGRGAPANAGGGGNWHNAGGGGGANAAASGSWTGEGVMLSTAAGVVGGTLAWPLDPSYPGSLASSTSGGSPGGGRGGYTYSNAALDPTLASGEPGLAGWNGNDRRERGGLGGHVLTSSPAGRLFMGGGGGAGDENNGNAVQGGRGGGLVFVLAGTVTGTGKIQANGAAGGASTGTLGDGPGGGGGGGTVVVHATSLAEISVEANGGPGGGQTINNGNEAEGLGGGGGGGYIAVSGGAPAAMSASGGLGGTTNSPPMLNSFPSNGATAGHDGVTTGDATTILVCVVPTDAGVDAQAQEAGSEAGAKDATPDVQAIDSPVVLQDAGAPDVEIDATPGLDSADGPGTVVFLDAGGDTSPGLDSVDAIAIGADAPAIIVDAPATLVDAPVTVVKLDAAAAADLAPIGGQDAPPIGNLDAARDATTADGEGLGDASAQDAQTVVVRDAGSIDAFAVPDVLPPDAQEAVADAPASVTPGPDAPVGPGPSEPNNNTFAVMGSGFCAVNPMRGSAPGLFTFFLLAGFGLVLRRRRH